MWKKLSLLLLLLCSSCTRIEIEQAAQSQPLAAPLKMVMRSQAVEIHNDWNGYSDITPILRHYKLRLEQKELVGNAHIALGGYGAAGINQQQTTKVKIPVAVTAKFLDTLAKTPIQVGIYKPQIERTDDYPSIKIQVKTDRQQVIFSSQSQGNSYVPWKVTVRQENTTTEYISNSALPTQALQLLSPYLDSSGIDQIIQRRQQNKK